MIEPVVASAQGPNSSQLPRISRATRRALAVVAPVEMPRPVPIVGLVRGEIQRTIVDEIQDVQDARQNDDLPWRRSAKTSDSQLLRKAWAASGAGNQGRGLVTEDRVDVKRDGGWGKIEKFGPRGFEGA